MANIGDQLTAPESGWKRIDDTDEHFEYSSNFSFDRNSGTYQSSHHFCTSPCSVVFYFTGSKLRIIGHKYSMYYSNDVRVYIDDKLVGSFSEYIKGILYQILLFSKEDMKNIPHKVKIESFVNGLNLDAIDISDYSDSILISEIDYLKYIKSNKLIKTSNNYIGGVVYPLTSNLLDLKNNDNLINIDDINNKISTIKEEYTILKIK